MAKKAVKKEAPKAEVEAIKIEKKPEPKYYTVKCKTAFFDLAANVTRITNDTWEVDDVRLEQLKDAESRTGLSLIEVL